MQSRQNVENFLRFYQDLAFKLRCEATEAEQRAIDCRIAAQKADEQAANLAQTIEPARS